VPCALSGTTQLSSGAAWAPRTGPLPWPGSPPSLAGHPCWRDRAAGRALQHPDDRGRLPARTTACAHHRSRGHGQALRESSGLDESRYGLPAVWPTGASVRGRRAHRRVRERGPGLPAVRRVRTRLCRQRRGQHGLKPQPAQSCPVALPAGRGELRRPPMTIAGTPRPARGRERIPIEEECHDRQPDG
jgi:hypothetical protein